MPKTIGNLTLYSIDDLHEKLGVSKMTLRTYLREGRIKGRKLGVSWYVSEEALREYFEGSSQKKELSTNNSSRKETPKYKYIVQGVNDLVSEEEECNSVEEAIECLENQAIISLFQVAVRNETTGEIHELIKAREFLNRYSGESSE